MKRVHVWIVGQVQGVNFRWRTREQAEQRGLAGWVRNLPDGRVEAVFEGDEEAIRSVIEWCNRGPRMAQVEGIEVTWEDPEGLTDFDVRF